MDSKWDQDRIQAYIDSGVQENISLDYKGAGALDRKDSKKLEITKDVSAMANSAGGILIYGIAEYEDGKNDYFPEKIDPIDVTEFPREWLEQVINSIRPRIDGILIHPVMMSTASNNVIYVVEIPQSNDAHQANDKRYYKRFNFMSVPMDDYEIRDVMGRAKYPHIDLDFQIQIETGERAKSSLSEFPHVGSGLDRQKDAYRNVNLVVNAINNGALLANYVQLVLTLPKGILRGKPFIQQKAQGYATSDLTTMEQLTRHNTVRDIVDSKMAGLSPIPVFGPYRYVPILPESSTSWAIELRDQLAPDKLEDVIIRWKIYADNAIPRTGEIKLNAIPVQSIKANDK